MIDIALIVIGLIGIDLIDKINSVRIGGDRIAYDIKAVKTLENVIWNQK